MVKQDPRIIVLAIGQECCTQGVYTPHLWVAQHLSTTYGGFLKTGEYKGVHKNKGFSR